MRLNITKAAILILLTIVYFSCKKDSRSVPIPPADIVTLKDSLMSGGGVRLFGKLTPDSQISGYGFEYGTDSLFALYTTLTVGKTPQQSNFSGDILVGLVIGQKYFYRAFKIENGTEERGARLSFTSQGSKPLILSSVTPSTAGMGDTVLIRGKYFDVNKTGVFFDQAQATILNISDSTITCIIPFLTALFNHGLSLQDDDHSRYVYMNFNFAAPVITSFTNRKFIGDTVQIIGNNFDKQLNFATEVDFGTVKAQIISTSKTKMTVIVPTIYRSSVAIKVFAQFQNVTSAALFTFTSPSIASVPISAASGSFITITGNNFFPLQYYDYDQVFVSGNKANIFTADRTSIKIAVPIAPYPTRSASISVNVLGQIVNYSGYLNITDTWLMLANNLSFSSYGSNNAFVIGNYAYCLALPTGSSQVSVLKYDPTANAWSQYQQFAQAGFIPLGVAVAGSKAYIYSSVGFWQYDPSTQKLTALASFPGAARNAPTIFSVGTSVYVGFGVNVGAFNDFYAYNTQNNTWKQVSGINDPNFLGVAGFFAIGSKGYVVYAVYNGNAIQEYNPETDTWTPKAHLNANNTAVGLAVNNMGYVCGVTIDNATNDCFQYNPVSDTWTQKANVGLGSFNNARFGFAIGSKSYFGISDNNATTTILYGADDSAIQ